MHRHGKQPLKENLCDKIALGDMVLIPGDGKPRGFWKLAKVESLITGNDGQTRGAVVRVASADRRPNLLRRPLQLLYPLDSHDKIDSSSSGNDAVDNDSDGQGSNEADSVSQSTVLQN